MIRRAISRVEIHEKMAKKGDFISLREAAEISGYSSDYIGQLIRNGKLDGKQVYTNVSWVTTEAAVRAYMQDKSRGKEAGGRLTRTISLHLVEKAYAMLTWFVIGFLGFFLVAMVYVLSVAVDERIERTYVENLSYGR